MEICERLQDVLELNEKVYIKCSLGTEHKDFIIILVAYPVLGT